MPPLAARRVATAYHVPRPAPAEAILSGLDAADDRVALAVRIMASTGLRRAETAGLRREDVVADLGGWSIRVLGKGRRERMVPIDDRLAAVLRALPPGFVFPGQTGGHLSPGYLGKLVSAALGDGVVPHQLRHAFATRAYAVDRDLLTVQQLLGHAKPETTALYARIPDEARRRTALLAAKVA